jgi:hypothetical protein
MNKKREPRRRNVSLRVTTTQKELTLEQTKKFLSKILTEQNIKTNLVYNSECDYYLWCDNNKCFCLPAGLCLYNKFISKERACANCTSTNIVTEINNLLNNIEPNHTVFWKQKQVRRRRKNKNE